jgi:predicted amidophosphoribosyltransferase
VAAKKKRLEDELAEERRKAVEGTAQFNTMSTGRSILYVDDLKDGGLLVIF